MGAIPTRVSATRSPEFISPRLAAAMSHPTRVHTMCVLLDRTASPRQVAEEIGERLNNVTYHINQLRKLGCIELVRTERVHGGRVLEHFYRATQRLYFDDEAWQTLTEKERLDLVSVSLRIISQDITTAMAAGTFFGQDNAHLCRTPMVVDPDGWREISDLLERTTKELFDIEARVAKRGYEGTPADIHARVQMLQFRAPKFAAGKPGDAV